MNQALFKRIYVDQTGELRGELAEPFSTLLSRPIRALTASHVPEVDCSTWEASFNEPEAPEGAPGLSQTILVGTKGLEPSRVASPAPKAGVSTISTTSP